jgi:hypothetical protein
VLPDWLEDYLKHLVDRYDLNISEVIRLQICFAVMCMTEKLFPDYTLGITPDTLSELPRARSEDLDREHLMRTLSKIYFEARKAVEYRLDREK